MVPAGPQSRWLTLRGLRHHLSEWHGDEPVSKSRPLLVLLHGFLDVSASFHFMVESLSSPRRVLALDWRGFGRSDRAAGGYWFPDYLADLDALLDAVAPDQAVDLAGHSMGGNVACLYAGIRPARIRRLINLEGFGLAEQAADSCIGRYARWLDEQREEPRFRDYASFDELAARLVRDNPRLTPERADFIARQWAIEGEGGRVAMRADPAHRRTNPVRYRVDEAVACWQAVTAPVLWVDGADSPTAGQLHLDAAELARRRACFAQLEHRVIADCGHMLHLDQPAALAALVEDFLG
jgi:pimeloyl-ACP methyl ester carboxylesterase